MIEIRNLSKRFGTTYALKNVTLTLDKGRTHVFLGSSGSGKSTLLRTILGLNKCDEGEILFEGQPVGAMSPQDRACRMGYVPQDGGLFPHLTAARNVSLVARAVGWERKRRRERMTELMPIVSLDPTLLKRYPKELSGGQRQRVAVLRAAFMDPDVLIFDEPLGALDPLVRSDLQTELKSTFSRLKKTVVFVTHDIVEAEFLGDSITLMHAGEVVQTGTMDDLRDRPAAEFVTRFLSAQRLAKAESR